MLRAVAYLDGHFEHIPRQEDISLYIGQPNATVWVDMLDPGPEELECLKTEFNFHPLSLEDVTRGTQRPKIEIYPTYYFLVFYALAYPKPGAPLESRELGIFLGPNYVVTVHTQPIQELGDVWERWQRRADDMGTDVGRLLYLIFDSIVDEYFPVVDVLADRAEDIEESIFEKFDRGALEDIFRLKKDLLALRRLVSPERDVLNVLLRRDPPILPANAVIFFQDVYDHLLRVLDSIDTYRDLLSSALDAYLSVQSNNLNEVMRKLTVISTIFLPLTFITGFFGMNFVHLPFDNDLFLWVSLGVMVLLPLAMLVYFRWRGLDE
jgi:magnesium transporter